MHSVVTTMPTHCFKLQTSDFNYVDAFEMQQIVGALSKCPDDQTLRKFHVQSKLWSAYKHNLVTSLRAEKIYRKGFHFRMNPVSVFKGKSISTENVFRSPETHRRLSPISKIVTVFPNIT